MDLLLDSPQRFALTLPPAALIQPEPTERLKKLRHNEGVGGGGGGGRGGGGRRRVTAVSRMWAGARSTRSFTSWKLFFCGGKVRLMEAEASKCATPVSPARSATCVFPSFPCAHRENTQRTHTHTETTTTPGCSSVQVSDSHNRTKFRD